MLALILDGDNVDERLKSRKAWQARKSHQNKLNPKSKKDKLK